MSGYGDSGGGPNNYQFQPYPGQPSAYPYHYAGGYPEQHGGSFGQGLQMGNSQNGVQPYTAIYTAPYTVRLNSPSGDISPFERPFLPAVSGSSFREDNKPVGRKRGAKSGKAGKERLEDSVDDLRKRIEKLEGEVRHLKQSGKRTATNEGEGQPETKVAKTEPEKAKLKVVEGKVVVSKLKKREEKRGYLFQQTLDYTIDDDKVFVCAAIFGSPVRMEVPLGMIERNGQPLTLDLLKENLGSAMRVYFYEHEYKDGKEVGHAIKEAELLPREDSTANYVRLLRSYKLKPVMTMKGNFIICSHNWIRITCYIDGKIRHFEVPISLISDRFGNLPMKEINDLKQELQSEIDFKLHRTVMDDEIVYFLTNAWLGNPPSKESRFDRRVPNTEGTEIHTAKYKIGWPNSMSVTTVIDGKEMTFPVPNNRVKFNLKYSTCLFRIQGKPNCYLYLRKTMKKGETKYRLVVVLLKRGDIPSHLSVEKPLNTSTPSLDQSGDHDSFIVLDELRDDDKEAFFKESVASKSREPKDTGSEQPCYLSAHKDDDRFLLQKSVTVKITEEIDTESEETRYSILQEDDEGIFQPVSSSEGYVHWKDQVFRVQPSDLWQEEVPFTNFDGLSPSPAQCRVAVIEDTDSPPHYELVVAALGELPSAESIMKVVKGQPGVLRFLKEADQESMVVEVDQKEYDISPSQLFLIGKSVENIEAAKEYYTRKVTVLFDANGSEIRMAFHPTRPDVCPVDRCLVEVSPSKTLKGSRQVQVLTGKYKGAVFSYADDEFEDRQNFRVIDCDILLTETNSFVLRDFNFLDTKPVTVNPGRRESRITLSRKFGAHIRKNVKNFFDFRKGLELPVSTSPAVVGMKVVNRLLAKLDSVVDNSLTEVLQTCFQECFPGRSSEDIQCFVSNCIDGIGDKDL